MKGPGIRYDIDIRRVWECSACGNRMKFLGDITASRCSCDAQEWMRLIIEKTEREFPIREKIVIPEEQYVEADAVEETPEAAVTTETPPAETVPESVAPEVAPIEAESAPEKVADTVQLPREKKNREQKKKPANQNEQPTAEQPDQVSSDSDKPTPQPEKPQPPKPSSSSSEEDDAFGENVFDD